MTGTFEIVFSGLCLFLLGGDGSGLTEVDVNLIRTSASETSTCEGSIKLGEHAPRLVIPAPPNGWQLQLSKTAEQDCSSINGKWVCNIQNRDLCVKAEGDPSPFHVVEGRDGMDGRPDNDEEARAFDWIAHLARIDGNRIARLKDDVTAPVNVGNSLITSRIHSPYGELSTSALGRRYGASKAFKWSVRPNRQPGPFWKEDHPKVLAEKILLRIEVSNVVQLVACNDTEYWWKFEPGEGPYRVGVHNEAVDDCVAELCTTGTEPYPYRLRHFLWYYELVEWLNGTCPDDYLSAPVCQTHHCKKAPLPGDANHFCPPTTYP